MQECRTEVERDVRYGEREGVQGSQTGHWRLGGVEAAQRRGVWSCQAVAPPLMKAGPSLAPLTGDDCYHSRAVPNPHTSCVLSSTPTPSGDVGDFPGLGFFFL